MSFVTELAEAYGARVDLAMYNWLSSAAQHDEKQGQRGESFDPPDSHPGDSNGANTQLQYREHV